MSIHLLFLCPICLQPVYGYASKNSDTFSNVSTKDGVLFFHDNKEINLRELALSKAFSSKNELGCSKISVQGIMPDMCWFQHVYSNIASSCNV